MKKTFWDRTAKIYDRFMLKDHKVYKQMYSLIYPVVRHKQVLELATGTGLIASFAQVRTRRTSPDCVPIPMPFSRQCGNIRCLERQHRRKNP